MINSKPTDRMVLDHDALVDRKGRVYVAVGNMHPPNGIIAYLKYIPSQTPTIWKRKGTWLKRVLRKYGAKSVSKVTKELLGEVFDPVLGTSVPFIRWVEVSEWLRPEEKLQAIIKEATDSLEVKAVDVALRISDSTGINLQDLGVTGSLLLGSHNPQYSDINLVVYGCKEALDIAYCEDLGLEPMPREKYVERIHNQSLTYGLPESILKDLNPPHKLRSVSGTPVGMTFVSKERIRYGSIVYRNIGSVKAKMYVEGGSCHSLQYPSITGSIKVIHVEGRGIRNNHEIKAIISYEGLFNWILFKGGCVRVKGVTLIRYPFEDYVILVGGKEDPGYVIPC